MISSKPIPFEEALTAARSRSLLPTDEGSAELGLLDPLIRERAWFSARTHNAKYLDKMARTITDLVSPTQATAEGREGINKATARLRLKQELRRMGYDPVAEGVTPGSLKDLSSDARLNLIIEMNADMLRGQGQYIQGLKTLAAFPAQELFRREERKEKRDWPAIWRAAGGEFYGGGRMIALKTDPIWLAISEFGLPYPPFRFGSGIWVRAVSRRAAKEMGMEIPPLSELKKQKRERQMLSRVEVSLPQNEALASAVQTAFEERAQVVDTPKGPRLALYPNVKSLGKYLWAKHAPQGQVPVAVVSPKISAAAKPKMKLSPYAEVVIDPDTWRHAYLKHGPESQDRFKLPEAAFLAVQDVLQKPDVATYTEIVSRKTGNKKPGIKVKGISAGEWVEVILRYSGKNILRIHTLYRNQQGGVL